MTPTEFSTGIIGTVKVYSLVHRGSRLSFLTEAHAKHAMDLATSWITLNLIGNQMPDLKSELISELRMSRSEIIWRVVRDMQPVTVNEVEKRTGINISGVYHTLHRMEGRGMVYCPACSCSNAEGTVCERCTYCQTNSCFVYLHRRDDSG